MKALIGLLLLIPMLLIAQEPAAAPAAYSRREIQLILEQIKQWYAAEDAESRKNMAQALSELSARAPEGELNPDAVKLARGLALLKAGDPEAALAALEEIEGFDSPERRAQLRQMKGNSQMQLAEKAVAEQDWQSAKTRMQAAMDAFSNALREDGSQEAARYNLELARKRLEEIKAQEPPPPPKQDQQDPQDQVKPEDQKDQEEKPDQKQDQNQDQQPQPDASGEQDPDQKQPQDQPDQQDQQTQPDQQDQAETSESSGESGQPENAEAAQTAEGEPSEEEKLDARQAAQILQSALEQEKRQRRQIQMQRIKPVPVEKDW